MTFGLTKTRCLIVAAFALPLPAMAQSLPTVMQDAHSLASCSSPETQASVCSLSVAKRSFENGSIIPQDVSLQSIGSNYPFLPVASTGEQYVIAKGDIYLIQSASRKVVNGFNFASSFDL